MQMHSMRPFLFSNDWERNEVECGWANSKEGPPIRGKDTNPVRCSIPDYPRIVFLVDSTEEQSRTITMADERKQTVVVVDDSTTMRTIIKKELTAEDYEVITFKDGLEALSSLHWMQKPPDLITLDIDMPRMDGFTCCERLREQESQGLFKETPTPVPVLFVSANDSLQNRLRGFHLGSLEFISKPFRRGDIAKAVNRVLRPHREYAGMTALVVDDDMIVRQLVTICLQRIGLTVLEASDGQEAYDLLRTLERPVDMAIVDFNMPRMRGDELVHLARRLPDVEHLPLLFLSSANEPEHILTMFRAGATDYLVKPFIAEELLARVQVHLQLQRHIRQLESMNQNLWRIATHDHLTGLYNKKFFLENVNGIFARAKRANEELSCLFFDLDHFKKVNDTHGHGFGDYVLATIGRLITQNTRTGDIAARYGGEEFVIALPGLNLDSALEVAERLRAMVAQHGFQQDELTWPVTISIGVASLKNHAPVDLNALMDKADKALYQAKTAGRNRVSAQVD
jgi:two-component system, cell cycle response regulator